MCGRYSIAIEKEEIEDPFHAKFDAAFTPRYNAAPSQMLPVILNDQPGKIVFAKWGIAPAWMTKRPDGLINVRAETLRDKPTFRSDFLKRRCVLIADGFYEWKATRAGKTPYRIHLKKNGPLAFAGIWEHEPETRFAIVTTAANTLLKPIHQRMPLIFMPNECGKWLTDNATLPKLLETLEPRAYKGMEAYEVSRRVNTAKTDTPDLITSIG